MLSNEGDVALKPRRGAFTGATNKREGRFSIANGGSIFLDEIGELSFDLQSKLLRVLQEGEFEPVGSSKTVKVDVRVIAATNRNLLKEIKEGRFREDLYYRLNVFQVELPPLRERPGDIEKLARAFLESYSKRYGMAFMPLTDEEIAYLESYLWPGNIRELQNVIERGVITSTNGRLDLGRALPALMDNNVHGSVSTTYNDETYVLSDRELRELEKNNIIRALERSGWKVAGTQGAAAILGIPTSTLNSKIKTFGIDRPSRISL